MTTPGLSLNSHSRHGSRECTEATALLKSGPTRLTSPDLSVEAFVRSGDRQCAVPLRAQTRRTGDGGSGTILNILGACDVAAGSGDTQ
ncbi:hypothetical protein PsYK624_040450 [Phanerochaete sordida]|uniref:Uncharacterized protein n=1 Tax=Phanerochaete sordida TaxID=48140 RepID=A0A9P3G4I4_9APHY|nr:hypothetical protein PsYK624_040450 [Phanerochaete sordida]